MFVHQRRCKPRRPGTRPPPKSVLGPSGRRIGVCQGLEVTPLSPGRELRMRWARIVRNFFQPPEVSGPAGVWHSKVLWAAWMSHRFRKTIHSPSSWWQYTWSKGMGSFSLPVKQPVPSGVSVLPASRVVKILGLTCPQVLVFRTWDDFWNLLIPALKWKQNRKKKGKEREREDKKRKEKPLLELLFQFHVLTLSDLLIASSWAWSLTCRLFVHKRRTG